MLIFLEVLLLSLHILFSCFKPYLEYFNLKKCKFVHILCKNTYCNIDLWQTLRIFDFSVFVHHFCSSKPLKIPITETLAYFRPINTCFLFYAGHSNHINRFILISTLYEIFFKNGTTYRRKKFTFTLFIV